MPRKVLPYMYNLPQVRQTQGQAYAPGQVSQTQGEKEQQQQQMPQMPSGLLKELMGGPQPYNPMAAGFAAQDFVTPAANSAFSSIPGYGAAGADGYASVFGDGMGLGSEYAGLLSDSASLADTATAAGTAADAATTASTAADAATAAQASIPVWGWASLAASMAKKGLKGSDPASVGGAFNTLLGPSFEEWMTDPGRSFANTISPIGLLGHDFAGDTGAMIGDPIMSLFGLFD